jgi:hypothetical protein
VTPGAEQVLSLAWRGRTLELLTGDSPAGQSCCSTAGVVPMTAGGRFGRPRTLVGGLGGATVGKLVVLGRRMLAAIGTERGVWVAQSDGSGRWGQTRRLAGPGAAPEALDATVLQARGAAVAWVGGKSSQVGPRSLVVASGSVTHAPRRARTVITVAPDHGIDELAIAPGPGGATAAWIESWYDRRGGYHSEVIAADLAHPRRSTSFAVSGTTASGLALAGDQNGDQVAAWTACTWNDACSVQAAARSAGRPFQRPARLGSIDPFQPAAAAVSSAGHGLLAWIDQGHVLARALRPRATRFSPPVVVSPTNYAANLALTFGPAGAAVAAWSQGTLAPDVVGAMYRG